VNEQSSRDAARSKLDYSVFDRLNLERKPVGVSFLPLRPEGIGRLDKALNFCEMFKEAQTSEPFYVGREDLHCIEPMLLGMEDLEPIFVNGVFGAELKLFKGANSARKIYQYLPRMLKGSVNYVAFSSLDRLTFEPDVTIIVADLVQARSILRSIAYSSGDRITSNMTHVATCAWMYIYPVLNGVMNYIVTGLGAGMEAAKPFPAGMFVISVPWNLLPTMIDNLEDMDIAPSSSSSPSDSDALRRHFKETGERLRQKMAANS
jgi:uncharacterized protein (DUF169 family)